MSSETGTKVKLTKAELEDRMRHLVDVDRRISGGWARGHFDVLRDGETLRIEFQNEFCQEGGKLP